jgi:hypothetical protein
MIRAKAGLQLIARFTITAEVMWCGTCGWRTCFTFRPAYFWKSIVPARRRPR